MKLNLYRILFTLLALMAGLSGCTKDPHGPGTGSGGTEFTISFEIPGALASKAALMTDDEENTIATLELLLFEGTTETFVEYHSFSGDIGNSYVPLVKTIRAELPVDGRQYRIVLIANAHMTVYNAWNSSGKFQNKTKAEVLEMLKIATYEAPDKGWEMHSPNPYIPMWGETRNLITLTRTTSIPTIQMLRTLARLDVKLGEELRAANAQSIIDNNYPVFEPKEIRLYNVHTRAMIAPDDGKYSPSYLSVTDVSLPVPSTPGEFIAPSPLSYTFENGVDSITRAIYLAEHSNVNVGPDEIMNVLIRGSFDGHTDTWYRVDLIDSKGDPIDITRNFIYTIRILEVELDGASTPEEALAGTKVRLYADVIPWNQVYVNSNIEGDYTLTVSKSNFEFNADGRKLYYRENDDIQILSWPDMLLDIHTGYSEGWKISRIVDLLTNTEIPEDETWVTIKTDDISGWSDVINDWDVLYPNQPYVYVKPNAGTSVRYARIDIQAGKWEYSVFVTQDHLGKCGRDGNFENMVIGSNVYPTHIYVDELDYYLVRCWMVKENLKEVESSYDNSSYVIKQYKENASLPVEKPEGARGYYYSSIKIQEGYKPCPSGWHVPDEQETWTLAPMLLGKTSNSTTYKFSDFKSGTQYDWWIEDPETNPVYGGYVDKDGRGSSWGLPQMYMSIKWSQGSAAVMTYLNFNIDTDYLYLGSVTSGVGGGDIFAPLRCVKDMDNKGL